WPDQRGARAKIDEEVAELDRAVEQNDRGAIEHELGDVLFSVVNLCRKQGLDPEEALRKANKRFETRFNKVESFARESGGAVGDLSLDELDRLWNEAKRR